MAKVENCRAYKILDSNSYWGVEVSATLSNNLSAKAALPLVNDLATELADNQLLAGKVVKQINQLIAPALAELDIGADLTLTADQFLKDLKAKQPNLTWQASLVVSLLLARLGAKITKTELYYYLAEHYRLPTDNFSLPTPLLTVFNGGPYADTKLDFEEFLLIPLTKAKTDLAEKLNSAAAVYHQLSRILRAVGLDSDLGSQGGFAPELHSNFKALELIQTAIIEAGYTPQLDFGLGLDLGLHSIYQPSSGRYLFSLHSGELVTDQLINLYREWQQAYPLIYLEDPLSPQDLVGWQSLTNQCGNEMIIAGDWLYQNHQTKFRQALKNKLANAVVVRLSEIYYLGELFDFIKLIQKHNYRLILAHHYSETTDCFLADLAVACNADYLKAGAVSRGERVAKYNRLLEINQTLYNT